ncbi:MAG: hypothetical protein PHI90_06140 [Clostridia bacterium]|nr:hypothetical protein [Clostridia bacterium]
MKKVESVFLVILLTLMLYGCSIEEFKKEQIPSSPNPVNETSEDEIIENKDNDIEVGEEQVKYSVIDLKNIPDLSDKNTSDKEVTDLIATLYNGIYGIDLISGIDVITFEPICISNDRKEYKDYLIVASIVSNAIWYTNRDILAILKSKNVNTEDNQNSYELCFTKNNVSDFIDGYDLYELIDIDSDGGQEIIFNTFEATQGGWERVQMYIFKYKDNNYEEIFNERLHEREVYPYCYDNTYEFVQNKSNPKFYDLVFKINTQSDQEFLNQFKVPNSSFKDYEISQPVKDEVVFSFDGDKYIPNKSYNYLEKRK